METKFDLAVIGGGPAGYTAAAKAGHAGLNVVLFEKNALGGVCLNEGCIPTKTLLNSAKIYDYTKDADKYGVSAENASFDLKKIMNRKKKVVRKLVMGVQQKMKDAKVTVINGTASIADDHHIVCDEQTYTFDNLILCTGSETFVPPIDGIDQVPYLTHREALALDTLPKSLIIIGGGVIGMEFASFFNSLGTQVAVVEMMDELLGAMDKEATSVLRQEYTKRGIDFHLQARVTSVYPAPEGETGCKVTFEQDGATTELVAEQVLMSVGRRPVTKGFGLENLPLQMTPRRNVMVNEYMQSSVPNVYVCGDLNGVSLLAHTAIREAEVAVNHILGGTEKMSYRAIPSVVYTHPEIAGVGATEEQLKQTNTEYKANRLPMSFSGRFVAENEGFNGFCKVLTAPDDTILGVHMVGNPASELIVFAGYAVEHGLRLADWHQIVFPHPTVSEILKEF